MALINIVQENTGQVVDPVESSTPPSIYYEPSENDKKLIQFITTHTDDWRDYRDQNFLDDWLKYERIWRGIWTAEDKTRDSERSRLISPATQQAIETRHAEIMEAVFGQGEFFDIEDTVDDPSPTGQIDTEKLKAQLSDDFKQDKLRKSIDQIALLAEIYGTGIGEIVISEQKVQKPMEIPLAQTPLVNQIQVAHGVGEETRLSIKLNPINPKNFLFDPNGTEIDDCMGCAVERYTSIHKVAASIQSNKYLNVDIGSFTVDDDLEEVQEDKHFDKNKVLLLTYYGLVPKNLLLADNEVMVDPNEDDGLEELGDDADDYEDMVEAIVVIGNGGILLKKEETPYMMKDRPLVSYQADTVPNRLLGRGTVEKAFNMQAAIDGSMRSHMDALALTVAPMIAIDATRLPRGAKYEVRPGKQLLTNGNPQEILYPFKFGTNDGMAMNTSKEFERMLLMATGTVDSNGTPTNVARDANLDMATATLIKKYKRTLVNFQEDFLIPFIYKSAWRRMQFEPQRYPSRNMKFIPTASLGIIAREYEQKQLAFMAQTLGAQSPLTPVLLKGILHNSSLVNREQMIAQLDQASQPDPQAQAMQQATMQKQLEIQDAEIRKNNAQASLYEQQAATEPIIAKAKIIAALSNNLQNGSEDADFEKRAKMADLMLKEKEINTNHDIAQMQFVANMHKTNTTAQTKGSTQ